MAKYSIQARTGTCRVTGETCPRSDHVRSKIPFETEIGVGKVIKGWDEGELLPIRLVSTYHDSQLLPHMSPIHRRSTVVARREGCFDCHTRLCKLELNLVRRCMEADLYFLPTGLWRSWIPTGHSTQRHSQV